MVKYCLINILLFISPFLLAQNKPASERSDFEYYKNLNRDETRLVEYKDNDEVLRLKLAQLDIINKSRKKFRATPLMLDILASRVANKMCREAAENNYISHWNLAGEKPYQRYAFAGGYDHVAENAYGEWTSGKYNISDHFISEMMKSGHESFMKERSPYDGHKKNVITKPHTHVGIGYFISSNQFRYYEEFIDRYLEFIYVPSELKVNESGRIIIDTRSSGYLYFMIVYREKFPQARRSSELVRTGSYEDYSNEIYLKLPAWDLAKYRNETRYTIPITFTKYGLYYIHLYTDKNENIRSTSLNTSGKSPVSGIVIKVSK
jgi:uncharacterized protein YkwD